jgi:hypothetical protein
VLVSKFIIIIKFNKNLSSGFRFETCGQTEWYDDTHTHTHSSIQIGPRSLKSQQYFPEIETQI